MTRIKTLAFAVCTLLGDIGSAGAGNFSPFSAINDFYKNNRFKGAFLTGSIKGTAADLVAQRIVASNKQRECGAIGSNDGNLQAVTAKLGRAGDMQCAEEKPASSIDWKRTLVFLLYGGMYQGCVQDFLYNDAYPYVFGTKTDIRTVISKVILDMGFISPLICIPIVYLIKGSMLSISMGESLMNYKDDIVNKGVLTKNWSIFIPVQCLTFSIIPEHFRVSFVAMVSFFWTIILSGILGSG